MKKKLFLGLLAAAAVSFTACQKDEVLNEVQQDEAISFSTYLGRGAQTKGTVINTAKLEELGFGVFAYYTGQNTMANFTGLKATENFMHNVQVLKKDWDNDNDTEWGYQNIKYWPNTLNDKISFYAYAPWKEDANEPLTGTLPANTLKVYTTNTGKANGVPTTPFIQYDMNGNFTDHIDVLFAPAQLNKTKENGVIPMTFYHALSKVGFKVKADKNYNPVNIVLKSVTFKSEVFNRYGTMDLSTANVTTETKEGVTTTSVNPAWTYLFQGPTSYVITANELNVGTVEKVVGSEEHYLMIFPQEFTGNGDDKITLTAEYTVDGIENSVSKDLGAFKFEAGKAYTFVINIGLATVDFTASVVDWDTTPGDTTVNINATNN